MLRMFLARRHEGFAGRWMLTLRPRQGVWARVEMRRCPLQGQVLECKSVVRGHGILAALIASLVMGSYRHDRPRRIIPSTESTPTSKGRRSAIRRFPAATGPLARIDLEPGGSNAGHLPPICGGTAHGELHCAPARRQPPVLTDGLVEAHLPAEGAFGVDRRDRLLMSPPSLVSMDWTIAGRTAPSCVLPLGATAQSQIDPSISLRTSMSPKSQSSSCNLAIVREIRLADGTLRPNRRRASYAGTPLRMGKMQRDGRGLRRR
ncbi:MAG: hypothetical protein QOF81_1020 [Acidimicrobiaceae bacterium]|jgi:hypothetical protein|nr:hypothetical protein [Acidimicrobiaceae bacterium]